MFEDSLCVARLDGVLRPKTKGVRAWATRTHFECDCVRLLLHSTLASFGAHSPLTQTPLFGRFVAWTQCACTGRACVHCSVTVTVVVRCLVECTQFLRSKRAAAADHRSTKAIEFDLVARTFATV